MARDSKMAYAIHTQQNQQPNPAPRYGGLVPPFYDQQEEKEITAVQIRQTCLV